MRSNNLIFDTPGWEIPIVERPKILNQKLSSSSVIPPPNQPHSKRKRPKPQSIIDQPSASAQPVSNHKHQTHSNSLSSVSETKNSAKKQKKSSSPNVHEAEQAMGGASGHLAQSLLNSNLTGSRFRILNETLYTCTGPEAAQLFNQQDGDLGGTNENFSLYHQGFRQQTKSWPQNPVNLIARQLQDQFKTQQQNQPRTVLVADLGCGEAPLAKLLCGSVKDPSNRNLDLSKKKKASPSVDFRVFSYDLVSDPADWVTTAECSSKVPLPGSSSDLVGTSGMMDVVVCCLSLMGTNWVGMILEARRILKAEGQLKIAEVTSRFINVDQFVDFIKLIGFSNPTKDQSNTHFILFTFKKAPRLNPTQLKMNEIDEQHLDQRNHWIRKGTKLLKPCIYKRR